MLVLTNCLRNIVMRFKGLRLYFAQKLLRETKRCSRLQEPQAMLNGDRPRKGAEELAG